MPVISKPQLDFFPEANSTISVSGTTASVAVGVAGDTFLLMNLTAVTVYFAQGSSTVTATSGGTATASATGDFPVPAGAILQIRALPTSTHAAAITDGVTGVFRVVRGSGL